jgi:hypothetical protein
MAMQDPTAKAAAGTIYSDSFAASASVGAMHKKRAPAIRDQRWM